MHPSIKIILIWQPLCMFTLTTFKWMTNDNIVIFWMTIKQCWKDKINTLSFFAFYFCEIKNEKWKHFHFSILVFEKSKLKNENTFVFRFLFCEIKNLKQYLPKKFLLDLVIKLNFSLYFFPFSAIRPDWKPIKKCQLRNKK